MPNAPLTAKPADALQIVDAWARFFDAIVALPHHGFTWRPQRHEHALEDQKPRALDSPARLFDDATYVR